MLRSTQDPSKTMTLVKSPDNPLPIGRNVWKRDGDSNARSQLTLTHCGDDEVGLESIDGRGGRYCHGNTPLKPQNLYPPLTENLGEKPPSSVPARYHAKFCLIRGLQHEIFDPSDGFWGKHRAQPGYGESNVGLWKLVWRLCSHFSPKYRTDTPP